MIKLRNILMESMEITRLVPIDKMHSFRDFLHSLVGKRLKDILDATSFARLYIGNKYGVGGMPDENDVQSVMTDLLNWTTNYINFRQIDPLRAKLDAADAEDRKRPEVVDYNKKRQELFRAVFDAQKAGDTAKANQLRQQMNALENPSSYSKNMEDMQALVKDFHNRPLTVADVTPSPTDEPKYKEMLAKAEEAFNKLKAMMGR